MEEAPLNFIATWNQIAIGLGALLLAIAILRLGMYLVTFAIAKGPKSRYDLISRHENGALWASVVLALLAVGAGANAFIVQIGPIWLGVRLFLTVIGVTVALISLRHYFKFYYPFSVERRLKKLRYQPRVSPKSKQPMKLLSEAEEDVYLDEGMQAEENIFSVDYDVWLDEETGYTQVEKYAGHLHAAHCPDCDYLTYKVVKEEILQHPSAASSGELAKYYKCGYCGYKDIQHFKIAKTKEEDLDPQSNESF